MAAQGQQIHQRKISLGEAMLTGTHQMQGVYLTQGQDSLSWQWTPHGSYSANSVYKIMIGTGKIRYRFTQVWKLKIPPKVRLFIFFLLQGKLLTRDVLIRRKVHCSNECVMCEGGGDETAAHLFLRCSFARAIWGKMGIAVPVTGEHIREIWDEITRRDPCLVSCALWSIWKSRNLKIFESKRAVVDVTWQWIVQEATLWKKFC